MYKLEFYVPESHLQEVKNAVFDAGAGKIGEYDLCCWETSGLGQFRCSDIAEPFLGTPGNLEKVREVKVEMVCAEMYIEAAVKALKAAHPYQTPAFQYWKVEGMAEGESSN